VSSPVSDNGTAGNSVVTSFRGLDTWPNFFIVGAAKSGTTSLYHYLSQHPDVYMSTNKEPHWFSRIPDVPGRGSHPVASEEEYLKLFKGRTSEAAVGEASPSYLWDESAPHRIFDAVPRAKIIAILRNPVERAYSHYMMDVRAGKQELSFAKALERDQRAEVKGWGVSDQYIDLGFYAAQLKRYMETFGGARVKVFLYEDLIGDPKALLRSAFGFLEVNPGCAEEIRTDVHYNKYSVPKNRLAKNVLASRLFRSRLSSALRSRIIPNHQVRAQLRQSLLFREGARSTMDAGSGRFLMDLYRTDIQTLQEMLNRDLSHWLRARDES
jgi:hypothetical protein